MRLHDPGPCIVCGKAHSSCCDAAVITQQLLPASAAPAPAPLVCEQIQATLPEGTFTSGTYRGRTKKPRGQQAP